MRYICAFFAIAALCLAGCSKDDTVGPSSQTDEQVLQQQVTTIDSVAQFSASEDASIDDNGLKDPGYDGVAKEVPFTVAYLSGLSADSLVPLRWGRHINWSGVVRDYHVVMLGDTGALASITKTIPGEFLVAFGYRTADTTIVDTIVHKPFTEVVKRNVLFKRVARFTNRALNWLPVAITIVQGKTQLTAQFSITSLEAADPLRSYDTTFTDPLNTWFRLGLFRGSIPRFRVGDSVDVKVTIASSDDSGEVVVLRHSVLEFGTIHRAPMRLVSTSGGPGNYTRVYEKRFRASLPPLVLAARFNAIVDVFSHGSIHSISDPFTNEFWGIPYIVVR